MDDHDVAGRDPRARDYEVLAGDALDLLALGVTERAAVAEVAVQPGVDPLRDREERRVGLEDQPSNIDVLVDQVSQAGSKELGDAPTGRG
jgi:hypothetical protein